MRDSMKCTKRARASVHTGCTKLNSFAVLTALESLSKWRSRFICVVTPSDECVCVCVCVCIYICVCVYVYLCKSRWINLDEFRESLHNLFLSNCDGSLQLHLFVFIRTIQNHGAAHSHVLHIQLKITNQSLTTLASTSTFILSKTVRIYDTISLDEVIVTLTKWKAVLSNLSPQTICEMRCSKGWNSRIVSKPLTWTASNTPEKVSCS